jgi:hypothetical protein
MGDRSVEELRDELNRLMMEQIESSKKHTFGGLDEEEPGHRPKTSIACEW